MRVKRKRVDVNLEELDRVLDHAREAPLSEPDYEKLKEALHALAGMLGNPRNNEKSSAVLRLFDEAWEFTYVKSRPINHNPYSFTDLASLLDFYIYIVLGYDYDTYENLGGTPYFQKASDIASLGRGSGKKGWQQNNSGYSRIQMIDELLSPKFTTVRGASYLYHFAGLDSLTFNPTRGLANMLGAIEKIGKAKKEVDPRNILIKTFFDTKSLEIADTFFRYRYPDPAVYIKFGAIDPSHQNTYEEYRKKAR